MATNILKDLVQQAGDWPEQDQQELADFARVIEARRTGLYRVTDAERAAIAEGLAEAEAGDFVSDAELAAAHKRQRV